MANTDTPFGLRPVRMAGGAPYNGAVNMYYVASTDATALFIGDPVVKDGSSDTDGVASVIRASAGGPFTGVVQGFVPDGTIDQTGYRAASTAAYVLVADDPNLEFEIQEDSVGGALAAADIGLNASVIVAAGSTYTLRSGVELDTSTKATTAGLELKILGISPRPGNAVGTNAKVRVRINDHTEAHASAGL